MKTNLLERIWDRYRDMSEKTDPSYTNFLREVISSLRKAELEINEGNLLQSADLIDEIHKDCEEKLEKLEKLGGKNDIMGSV